MRRTLMLATMLGVAATWGLAKSATAGPLSSLLAPVASVSTSADVVTTQVTNVGWVRPWVRPYVYSNGGYNGYYSGYQRPYYSSQPYAQGYYYPRYYGTPRFGYYDNGYGRGAVRVGPRIWW